MAGATIDHMISLTILVAALLIAMMSFNQMFSSAVAYETNTQVATKAMDLINTICLSPGNPTDWGSTNQTVLGFGLQDPSVGGYALSPYSLMRLNTVDDPSQLLEYPPGSGEFYNNLTASFGDAILTPLGDCVNYTTAAELLGITGEYGFSLDVTPTLDVQITKRYGYGHLALEVDVSGSGLPLSGASLNYYLLYVQTGIATSKIVPYIGVDETDSSGSVILEFEDVDENGDAYQFMTYVRLNGLTGMGYYSQDDLMGYPQFVVPLIRDYDEGIITIAHSWGVHEYTQTPVPNVTYNATFFVLTSDFQLQQYEIENSTGQLNYGSKNYETTQLPTSEVGILFISYRWANRLGSVALPWGIGTLGVSASFDDELGSGSSDFVATEIRQVTIDGISYRVKVGVWKLGN